MDTDHEDGTYDEPDRDPLELSNDYDGFFGNRYEETGQEQMDPQKLGMIMKDWDTARTKAAKKALKKAKKKALKRLHGACISPMRSPCNGSPR